MPKPKQSEPQSSQAPKTTHQRFEYREIPRAQIRAAPYNPRQINAYQRKNLQKDLERFGCVEPLVWNQRSGLLVSGHQRLSIMDDLEGRDDYVIGVSVVDLTPKQERELNVLLNNPQAQGSYTKDGLLALIGEGLDLDAVGLTKIDLEMEFGELPDLDELMDGLKESKPDKPKPDAEKLNKNKLRKEAADKEENDADYFLIVAFDSRDEKEKWLTGHSLVPDLRMISYAEAETYFAG